MIENIGQWITMIATVLGGITAIFTFWNQFVYKPIQERKEELAEKRNHELIEAYRKFSQPSNKLLTEANNRVSKLEEIAEMNSQLLSRHEQTLDNHNERLIVLETKNGLQYVKKESD